MKIKQLTLTDIEHAGRKKTTRREEFLTSMDAIIPWEAWIEMIRPHYPSGKRGRPVRGIETMLRMYLLQVWFIDLAKKHNCTIITAHGTDTAKTKPQTPID